MIKHINNWINKNEFSCIFMLFVGFWFFILFLSKSIFSGFHFIDDHQILTMHRDFVNIHSFGDFKQFFVQLLNIHPDRFIPFYFVHRVFELAIFGTNHVLWSVYTGMMAVFSSFFLYIFSRKLDFSKLESLILPFTFIVGYQSVIWYELGRTENIGILMLSLTLMFMALSIKSKRYNTLFETLFIISALLMSLCKESFILIIPALLLWKLWLYSNEKKISLLNSLKRNIFTVVLLATVVFAELIYIIALKSKKNNF